MKKTKLEKGITLIALIITIVILLILAVVTIGAIKNSKIITHAQDSSLIYEVARIEEALKLKIQEEKLGEVTGELPKTPDTIEELEDYDGDYITYGIFFLELRYMIPKEIPFLNFNIYNDSEKNRGEIIAKDVIILPTDIIIGGEGFYDIFGDEGVTKSTPLNIDTTLGKRGIWNDIDEDDPIYDMFFVDDNYNVYYIDENQNVVTSSGIYKNNESQIGNSFFNVDNLSESEKKVYQGIYEGALAYTGDSTYASYLAKNDLDYTAQTNTFYLGGYFKFEFSNEETEEVIEYNGKKMNNMVALMTRPDWSVMKIVNDPIKINYYMDEDYTMYKYDRDKKILYDGKDKIIATNVESDLMSETSEYNFSENNVDYKYEYLSRFDDDNCIIIISFPDKEIIDIEKDLENSGLYMNCWYSSSTNENIKQVILPSTTKTLNMLALTRNDNYEIELFSEFSNVECIDLSKCQIQKIYANAFSECSNLKTVIMPDTIETISDSAFKKTTGVEVRFNNGVAPSGYPWGGTNLTVTSK